jgi:hypothetical protein
MKERRARYTFSIPRLASTMVAARRPVFELSASSVTVATRQHVALIRRRRRV